jgi:hypothetical protein
MRNQVTLVTNLRPTINSPVFGTHSPKLELVLIYSMISVTVIFKHQTNVDCDLIILGYFLCI